MNYLPIKRALISVTDKTGIIDLAGFLTKNNVEIVSTGGTARLIRENNIEVTGISQVTGFPEILGGRVKTLHPKVHGGVLADKDNPDHDKTLKEQDIGYFDLVCVNLYDFAGAVAGQADIKDAVEKIDIGGPTLLRAAAKNFHSVCVLPHPDYYQTFMNELSKNGAIDLAFRQKTAWFTFDLTSRYDTMIADYLHRKTDTHSDES
ncbi:IMP cyclohydrolase [Desulfonatronovibrio magnus]|uniref:IMP cyclohydrolase n=1 Tax=Desulfonatronovibrio magnus TaxID=698827 RepID=UPI0005EB494C|nr:IMP cyclohydrolase [Desulfonatronovibrio magnus]